MRDFNFFKPYLGEEKESKNTKKFKYGLIIILIIFIAASYIWNGISIMTLNKDINKVENKLNDADRVVKYQEAEKLLKEKELLSEYESKLGTIYKSIYSKDMINSKLIVDISSGIPEKVYFQTIAATTDGLTITGTSKDRVSIAELVNNLSASEYIGNASINNVNEGASEEFSFTINCSLKEGFNNED